MVLDHVSTLGITYAVVIGVVGLLSAGIAGYAWRRQETPGATSLAALMTGVTIWNLSKAIQILLRDAFVVYALEVTLLLGVGLVVAAFVGLVFEFTGRAHLLTRRTLLALSIEPTMLFVLGTTNAWHGLVWKSVDLTGSVTPVFEVGFAFWLHTAYSFGLLLGGLGLLVQQLTRPQSIYRRQAGLVLVGAIAPMTTNLLSLSGVTAVDLTPIGFAITGVAIAWAITQDQLIDLVPIARAEVVETLPDPVFVVDERERVTDCNDAATTLVGASEAEIIGEPLESVLSAFPALTATSSEALAETEHVDLHTGDGPRSYEVRVSPLSDERGERRGRLLLFHDVTELQASRRDLEHQNEQLERFASVVSHDLRNPLSVAEGYLDLAKESGDEDHFEAVEESLDRMNAIIEDVLTLAREGATIEDRQPTSLATVAETAWSQVDTADAELVVADDVRIGADPARLQRLLENCFRNAMEHAGDRNGDGGNDVTVTVGSIEPEGSGSVRGPEAFGFYVADDGVGIPEAKRDGIFEPGHSSSSEGTGLGLSIVQGIAEAHGWTVRATAAEDGGARFEFLGAPPISHPAATRQADAVDGAQR